MHQCEKWKSILFSNRTKWAKEMNYGEEEKEKWKEVMKNDAIQDLNLL